MNTISLIFIASTGAGPVYSFAMAKAIAERKEYQLNLIISNTLSTKTLWHEAFDKDPNVNIVEVCTYKHNMLSVLLSFFRVKTIRKILKILYASDICYIPFGFMWAPIVYPRLKGKCKLITTIHDPHPHNPNSGFIQKVADRIDNYHYSLADHLIMLNKKDLPHIQERYPSTPITVVPHASFDYYSKIGDMETQEKIYHHIAFLGTISWYKGLDILVDAFQSLSTPDMKLTIAGKGTIEEDVLKKIEGDKNIILMNRYVEDKEFGEILKTVDFVVLPYRNASQSGVIPLAYSFGKTVIATNVGALDEQVPGDVGVLVEPSPKAVAKAIDDMYKDEEKLFTLNKNAKKYADTELTWEHSAELMSKVFKSLL